MAFCTGGREWRDVCQRCLLAFVQRLAASAATVHNTKRGAERLCVVNGSMNLYGIRRAGCDSHKRYQRRMLAARKRLAASVVL